jgi:hypothetical protein
MVGALSGLSRPLYCFYLNEMTHSSPALFEKKIIEKRSQSCVLETVFNNFFIEKRSQSCVLKAVSLS